MNREPLLQQSSSPVFPSKPRSSVTPAPAAKFVPIANPPPVPKGPLPKARDLRLASKGPTTISSTSEVEESEVEALDGAQAPLHPSVAIYKFVGSRLSRVESVTRLPTPRHFQFPSSLGNRGIARPIKVRLEYKDSLRAP